MKSDDRLFDRGRPADDAILVRYLSFSKLMNLLTTRSLFLSRIDQFSDPLEGRFTVEDLKYLASPKSGVDLNDWENHRMAAYALCWSAQVYESDAHWQLYAAKEECVAIVTTAAKLDSEFRKWTPDLLNATYAFGLVRYVDPSESVASEVGEDGYRKSLLRFATLKDRSFKWEEEARVVVFPRDGRLPIENWPIGMQVPVDVEQLIDRIIVGPNSQPWLLETVASSLAKYGLNDRVAPSELTTIRSAHRQ